MNKQELIEKIIDLGRPCLDVVELVKQLDEPQPVKVPQFVADWYEENKDDFEFNVWDWIAFSDEPEKLENKEFNDWINDGEDNPIQTLVNMHQFGYEVEEEKRYFVKAKSIGDHNNYLKYNTNQKHWYFGSRFIYVNDVDTKIHHTRKELEEANFGWVFDCPEIEIEEVE